MHIKFQLNFVNIRNSKVKRP